MYDPIKDDQGGPGHTSEGVVSHDIQKYDHPPFKMSCDPINIQMSVCVCDPVKLFDVM